MEDMLQKSLLVSVLVVVLLQIVKKCLLTKPKLRLPPGPWKLPIIGGMHHLMNVLPHRALRDLARVHGPIMMLQLGETRLVVVSSKEIARQVLRTHDANFGTRPKLLTGDVLLYGCADIVFSPSGEYWRKLRQLCIAEILSPKRVSSFRHIREHEMARMVERVRSAGPSTPVDLSAMFLELAIAIISRASFGKKLDDAMEYLSAVDKGAALANGFKIPDLFPTWRPLLAAVTGMRRTLVDVHTTVDSTLEEIITARRRRAAADAAEDDDNLVDVLLGLQERAGLS
ncbi:hypothetical protein ACP70R_020531 [Stipagrostis hirtigluma subsp. patula]